MDKLGRNYLLSVQKADGTQLIVEPPFTVEFDIVRKTLGSANHASIRIYNLSSNNRSLLRRNWFQYGDRRTIELRAGYGRNLAVIFNGTITSAFSNREGVNFITTIECQDGGFAFANAQSSIAFPKQTTNTAVLQNLMNDLKPFGVDPGAIGNYPGNLLRGNSYVGPTTSLLYDNSDQGFFIDNSKAYCLGTNECIEGDIPTIQPSTGLLNTPMLEDTKVTLELIFEPRLKVGQLVALNSFTADKSLNGNYKVIGLQHRGMISQAVCGSVITSVELFSGTQILSLVNPL